MIETLLALNLVLLAVHAITTVRQGRQRRYRAEALAREVEDLRAERARGLRWSGSDTAQGSAPEPEHLLRAGLAGVIRRLAEREARDPTAATEAIEVELASPFSVVDEDTWAEAVRSWRAHGVPLVSKSPTRPCPACDGENHARIFESYDGFPFHACADCGAWFVPHRVDTELYRRFFEECPAAREAADRITRQRLTAERTDGDKNRFREYFEALVPYVEAGAAGRTYLDVGCGLGYSLEVAEEYGFRAHGIEVDESSVRLARDRGLSVDQPDDAPTGDKISLLALWETIEHLHDPRAVLVGNLPRLAEGGVVALTFPNLDSPMVRYLRSECVYVHGGVTTPGHINLFHRRSIAALLGSLGLEIIDTDAQFGSNLQELMLYARGIHSGAIAYFDGSDRRYTVRRDELELNNAVAPSIALLERVLHLSPILRVFACRSEDAVRFAGVAREARERRAVEITARAEDLLPPIEG